MLNIARAPNPPAVDLSGVEVCLDPSGAVFLPASRTLIVADLHFEKGSAFARRGQFLPPYDTAATLATLARVIDHYQPHRVISLGDAFHDRGAAARMADDDAARLEALCGATDWLWILGNHDPEAPTRFSGAAAVTAPLGGLTLVHEPDDAPNWSMAGHLHPCAAVSDGRGRLRRRCFVSDGQRMVLPAFGAFTGGLNILDDAYATLFRGRVDVHVIGRDRIYRVPETALRPDRA